LPMSALPHATSAVVERFRQGRQTDGFIQRK
jgi:hypothetical protein